MSLSPSTWWHTLSRRTPTFAAASGLSRRALWVAAGACLLAGLGTQLAFPSRLPDGMALLRESVVVAGFVALWFAARPYFEKRPSGPLRTLGTPILGAVGLILIAVLPWSLGVAVPALPATGEVLARHLLVLPELAFSFFLLLQLRRLVLYRRTRQSQRNWRLMLGLMSVAALTAFGSTPGQSLGTLQILPIVAAVALMVVNSFRLSWIIGLSVREKVTGAALSWGLLVTVALALFGFGEFNPSATGNPLEVYSYSLDVFVLQTAIFGILYSLTTLLSLVFHLPTTGDVQRKSDETAALHALAHLVDQTFDAKRLSASIAAAPVEAGSADAAWLALDGASERLIQGQTTEGPQVVATARLTAQQAGAQVDLGALFAEVRRTQAPLVLDYAHTAARVYFSPESEVASLLVVPLVARGVFVGALFAARNVARGFEEDDISSIQAFASQAALALDHARLFEEQIEKERLERELDIARAVQERLLPHRLPTAEGLELAAGSTPAREVGGDYYDFASLEDGRLAFIVADVSGKGTQAAFYMAEMQGLFRALCPLRPEPVEFLSHANEALRGILEEGTFVSALYGVVDPGDQTLTLARAGHCPVAFSRDDETPRLLRPDGMGLGMAPSALFQRTLATERLHLHPGDTLALYTDGLVESRSADGEEYGYERLLDSLERHAQCAPAALRDGLLDDLCAFTASDAYDDDLTLVILRRQGTPPRASVEAPASPAEPASSPLAAPEATPARPPT